MLVRWCRLTCIYISFIGLHLHYIAEYNNGIWEKNIKKPTFWPEKKWKQRFADRSNTEISVINIYKEATLGKNKSICV